MKPLPQISEAEIDELRSLLSKKVTNHQPCWWFVVGLLGRYYFSA